MLLHSPPENTHIWMLHIREKDKYNMFEKSYSGMKKTLLLNKENFTLEQRKLKFWSNLSALGGENVKKVHKTEAIIC